MENYWQWALLLLPLAFLAGWLLSKRRSRRLRRQLRFSNDYFQGLNYLLNDEQDKALDVFIKLVEMDWDTVDTSLALAAIFRRKGEIDKSIKLHQSLLARPSLPAEYKSRVLLELGRDYQLAGWLDRAEGLFNDVLKDELYAQDALRHLIEVYQQEHEWQDAIKVAEQFQKQADNGFAAMVAQFYCELSEQRHQQGDNKEAESLASQALSKDESCVRASIILARLAMQAGKYKKALRFLKQVEVQNAGFLPVIINDLYLCYQHGSGVQDLIQYLQKLEQHYPEVNLCAPISELILQEQGESVALDYLTSSMLKKPDLKGIQKMLQLQGSKAVCEDNQLPEVIDQMLQSQPEYQCSKCGYSANTLFWLCPSCHSWASMKPR